MEYTQFIVNAVACNKCVNWFAYKLYNEEEGDFLSNLSAPLLLLHSAILRACGRKVSSSSVQIPVIWASRSSLHFTSWRTSSVEHRIDFFSRTPYRFLQSNTVSISSVEHRIDFFSRTPYRFLQSNTVSISSVEHRIDFFSRTPYRFLQSNTVPISSVEHRIYFFSRTPCTGEILQHCHYAMIRW